MRRPSSYTHSDKGFTLVELLVVIMVLTILLAVVAPTLYPDGGPKLEGSTSLLVSEISAAQQLALRDKSPTELRLYSFDPPSRQALVSRAYRAYQTFRRNEEGQFVVHSNFTTLEDPIIILSDSQFSSIADLESQEAGDDFPLDTRARYVAFRFNGDGSTNLPKSSSDNWFITLASETSYSAEGSLPPDFITLQIDPVNGRVRTFRPE
ncbi:MAG: Verru_Chthon cassette protein D [Verrucomicrobiota bacterium]